MWPEAVSGQAVGWLEVLLDATVKGIIILAVAGVLSLTFRRASAATRHLIWLLAVVSLVALPVLSVMTPQWRIPILPEWVTTVGQPEAEPPATEEEKPAKTTPVVRTDDDVPLAPPAVEEQTRSLPSAPTEAPTEVAPMVTTQIPEAESVKEAPKPRSWPLWVLLAWGAGTVLVLVRLLCGTVGVWRLAHGARHLRGGPWKTLVGETSAQLGLKRRVVLLQSGRATMPVTWGLLRPVALLPADADGWTEDRKRIVMLHELAHVKRWDCFTQMVTQLACAVYWFNPLAWLAARQVGIERERACDDLVLRSGFKASDYGQHLLDIVRSLRSPLGTSLTSVSIARKSRLEGRLLAILDPLRNRRALTRLAVIVGFLVLSCVLVPLGTMRLAARAEEGADPGFSKATVTMPQDENGKYLDGDPPQVITLTDRKDIADLASFFPEVGQGRRAHRAAGWEAGLLIEFERPKGKSVRVSVSGNDDLTVWSEGQGDWPVKGDLKAYVATLRSSSRFKATLSDGTVVELVGISYHPSKGQPWWRPDGGPLEKAPYENATNIWPTLPAKRAAYEIAYSISDPSGKGGRSIHMGFPGNQGLGTWGAGTEAVAYPKALEETTIRMARATGRPCTSSSQGRTSANQPSVT